MNGLTDQLDNILRPLKSESTRAVIASKPSLPCRTDSSGTTGRAAYPTEFPPQKHRPASSHQHPQRHHKRKESHDEKVSAHKVGFVGSSSTNISARSSRSGSPDAHIDADKLSLITQMTQTSVLSDLGKGLGRRGTLATIATQTSDSSSEIILSTLFEEQNL